MPSRTSTAVGRIVGALFVLSLVGSFGVWKRIVLPVLRGDLHGHETHAGLLYAHAASGTVMLFCGAVALYIGWTRRFFSYHRWFGGFYLFAGLVVSVLALVLPLFERHEPASIAVATNVIASVWMAFSAMAWRAARNRRFDAHRGWMVRSYVVTWTFVFCRMAMQLPLFPSLGDEAITVTIWISFVIPVVVCEIVMQWPSTAPLRG